MRPLPDDVREAFRGFGRPGERLQDAAPAGDGWVYVSSKAVYAGSPLQRVRRSDITALEMADRLLLVLGDGEELARAEFREPQRPDLLRIAQALSPARRRLKIEAAPVRSGEFVQGSVHLEWPNQAPVRGIHFAFFGEEGRKGAVRKIVFAKKRLFGGPPVTAREVLRELTRPQRWPELPRGHHTWPFRVRLPAGALPSVDGKEGWVRYRVQAHVDLPLAIDLVAEKRVRILPRRIDPPAAIRDIGSAAVHLRVEPVDFGQGFVRGEVRAENRTRWPLLGVEIRLLVNRRPERRKWVALADPNAVEHEFAFHLPLPPGRVPYRGRWSHCVMAVEARLPRLAVAASVPLEG